MEKTNYLGNINVKKDGIQEGWDKESILEYQRCMQSAEYFTLNYCKIIKSRWWSCAIWDVWLSKRNVQTFLMITVSQSCLHVEQSGKSISTVAYLLWFALFNPDKTIAVLANKGSTAREMLFSCHVDARELTVFLATRN